MLVVAAMSWVLCAIVKTVWHLLVDLQHSQGLQMSAGVFCVRVFCDTDRLISIVEFPDHTILVSTSTQGDHSRQMPENEKYGIQKSNI